MNSPESQKNRNFYYDEDGSQWLTEEVAVILRGVNRNGKHSDQVNYRGYVGKTGRHSKPTVKDRLIELKDALQDIE